MRSDDCLGDLDIAVDGDRPAVRADAESESGTNGGAVCRERHHHSTRRTVRLPGGGPGGGTSAP